jgi:hypothetical protein
MYIIDKNRDYYDHFSHIYGVDKRVVFDRRGSRMVGNRDLLSISFQYFWGNIKQTFVLLEVGNVQYLFRLHNFKIKKGGRLPDDCLSYSIELARTFSDNINRFGSPISLRGADIGYVHNWKQRKRVFLIDRTFDEAIARTFKPIEGIPILAATKITSLIDGERLWRNLQTYISSLDNDRDVSINMTEEEKAEVHGFDRKTSFRHPVK